MNTGVQWNLPLLLFNTSSTTTQGAVDALFSVIRPYVHNGSWELWQYFIPDIIWSCEKFLYNQAGFEIVKVTAKHEKRAGITRIKKENKKSHVKVFYVSIRRETLGAKTSGCRFCARQDSKTYAHFTMECWQGPRHTAPLCIAMHISGPRNRKQIKP